MKVTAKSPVATDLGNPKLNAPIAETGQKGHIEESSPNPTTPLLMSLRIDDVVRNASGLIRRVDEPMDGAYALIGLTTLRLEDKHFEVGSWPQKARWERLEERITELEERGQQAENVAPIYPIQEAVREAIAALRSQKDTEDIGGALDELGLSDLRSLVAGRFAGAPRKKDSPRHHPSRGEIEKELVEDYVGFVRQLNVAEIEPEQVARLSDEFLSVAGEMSSTAEFFTPPSVASLVARLLKSNLGEADSIYDPTAGSAGLLLTVHREAERNGNRDLSVVGQEIQPRIAAVARINARLHGVDADIAVGDTLTDPQHVTKEGGLKQFDVVVANPPMGVREKGERLQQIKSAHPERFQFGPVSGRRLDASFLQHAVSSVNDTGCAGLVCPPYLLRTIGKDQEVLKGLLEEDLIEAAIQLPNRVLADTGIGPALFLINRSKPEEKRGTVLLVDASREGDQRSRPAEIDHASRRKITSIVTGGADVPRFSIEVTVEEILANSCNLVPSRYILDRDITGFLRGHVEWKSLQDIATVTRGAHVETSDNGDVPVLTPGDLVDQLPSDKSRVRRYGKKQDSEKLPRVKEGDIVLSTGPVRRAGEVTQPLSGALCSRYVCRIRLEDEAGGLKAFLIDFLNSSVGTQLLKSRGRGGHGSVPIQELKELPVPIPGADVAGLVHDLKEVEQELSSQMKRIKSLRGELFDFGMDEEQAGKVVRKLTADAKILSSSLGRTDDLDYRVRNFYPFPLAYVYRGLQSIGNPIQQHGEILRIIEHVVSFLASIGVSIGRYEDLVPNPDDANLSEDALRDAWRGGIALGTWKTLAQSSARVLREHGETDLASDFSAIWFAGSGQSEFDACVDDIVQVRNDASHGRGPTTRMEYQEEVEELSSKLEEIYEEIGFLVNYPLHYIRNLDLRWGEGNFRVEHLRYTGDHPGMEVTESNLSYPVTRDLLYIESGDERWVPLHPIVSVQHCPQCKRRETYALDKWSGKEKYSLKSFERGHAVTEEDAHMKDIGDHIAEFFGEE